MVLVGHGSLVVKSESGVHCIIQCLVADYGEFAHLQYDNISVPSQHPNTNT